MKNSPTFTQNNDIALAIVQKAVRILATWTNSPLELTDVTLPELPQIAVTQAINLLDWQESQTPEPLRVLFDQVQLTQCPRRKYYWNAVAIADTNPSIPYPQPQQPEMGEIQDAIRQVLTHLTPLDWQNLSLLTLILEKFASHLSLGQEDVALIDLTRATAAIAVALANTSATGKLMLIAGDLSGIQSFIYTISSDGALKSLRARSFYLELVTEEVVQQLLDTLELPRTTIIYAGGGNLYLIAAATPENCQRMQHVQQQINQWLLHHFQGNIFLALDSQEFDPQAVKTAEFAQSWSTVTQKLAHQKSRKFAQNLSALMQPRPAYDPCRVCHRDDVETLYPLNPHEPDSVLACDTCRQMFQLGGELFHLAAIIRSHRPDKGESPSPNSSNSQPLLSFQLPATEEREAVTIDYRLYPNWQSWKQIDPNLDTVFLVNDWTIDHYSFRHYRNAVPLLLGNYGQRTQKEGESGFMSAAELADIAPGIQRVGYLRMDVDRLGQIFARGLGEKQTLARVAGLSRLISYFFKVYLNSLAQSRPENFLSLRDKVSVLANAQALSESLRQNLLFIYAGGDDVFVSGAWNEVVDFGFDVYQCFRAYTGHHPDITLSGGISLAGAKFPLYQAADAAGEAEEAAKGNGRQSLSLFGQVFKWEEWLGNEKLERLDPKVREYLQPETQPPLWGVFPLVSRLSQQLDQYYSRRFVRHLLITADLQEKMLDRMKDQPEKQQWDTRYFLHLPKIAYTLARLPQSVLSQPTFQPIRVSLKSPYNAPYFRAIATWIEALNRDKGRREEGEQRVQDGRSPKAEGRRR